MPSVARTVALQGSVGVVVIASLLSAARPAHAQATAIQASDASGLPGSSGIIVTVSTTAAITVGATDLVLTFNPSVLEATGASSQTLSGFTFLVDNAAGEIRTASASGAGDSLGAGSTLFIATFSVRPGAPPGPTILGIVDGDGTPPDDLSGVPPPIPPPAILYSVIPGVFTVNSPATMSPTPSPTGTPLNTTTFTPSPTGTSTPTSTETSSPTAAEPTVTPTPLVTSTPTATLAKSASPTKTTAETETQTPTEGASGTATATATAFPTETGSPSPSATASVTPSPTEAPSLTLTATPTPSQTPLPSGTLTPTSAPTMSCTGDCDGNAKVTIDELVIGVDTALGITQNDSCTAFDCNGTGEVTVDCLVKAVDNALNGCPQS